jgi:2'-5' RNA ligase
MFRHTSAQPPAKRGLYFMSKARAAERAAIAGLPRCASERDAHLLHITLLALVDLAEWPAEFLSDFLEMTKDFQADAFPVQFDRIVENAAVTLSSSKPLRGAVEFQKQLVHFLTARDFSYFGKPPKPHLTIRYGRDGKGSEPITPIGWMVEEVLLIESLGGKSTHVEHGRWQLAPLLI